MCLFECEIGWMENFGEKMGRKTFLECVWLGRNGKYKWWGLGVFSPDPPKCFFPKNGEKTKWG